MAEISIVVTTPKVPNFIEVKLPGASRSSRIPLSEFTDEQLEAIAGDFKDDLVRHANKQRKAPTIPSTPAKKKAKSPSK